MTINTKALVVISYYDRRPIHNLCDLIKSLLKFPAGAEYDLCVVVNRTTEKKLCLPDEYSWIPIEYRHNLGMNIGAWDYGWRTHKEYRDYLFLQDECYVVRDQWLRNYRVCLEQPDVGMVGESLSKLWDRPWRELERVFEGKVLPEHAINGKAVNRVNCYLNFFRQNQINPGETGRHLRSVIWFLPRSVLERIDGFLIGRNYGECIAAEIAVSKKIEEIGFRIAQASEEEFFFIRHLEYNQDHPGSPFSHDVKYVDYASVQRLLESKEAEFWHILKKKFQKLAFRRPKMPS
jgi:hypothetical protein